REKGKTFADYANGNKDSGLEGFALFEQIIKENGFKNYEEFTRVNAKIAWAFILLQGEQGIENFAYWKDSLKNEGEKMYQQSFSELDNAINDPSTPEETKQQLKETKAQLKEQRTKSYQHIEQRWENDKKWASWVIEKLKYITSEDDLKIVKKYQKHLQEVYTDIKLPSLML
ncbi:MAG: hypothetical protein NZ521_07375, partial [Flammeovirgaceae bacterium]|nr:hypothetical protein [Flammeovirgaceae bacterium]MDW8288032.1 hypothetical protein [Flammeovirgaceae bacterium]